jgi:excisionase family DNA binding protein
MKSPSLPDWLPRRLMTVAEAAELLQQSPRQVWRLIADGRLQVTRVGRSVRVTPEAIAALLGLV